MHFCVSAARVSLPGIAPAHLLTSGARSPRKMGTNWFMPAFVKRRFGESGMSDALGTMVCLFSRKKSRNCWRIWVLVSMARGVVWRVEKGAQATWRGAKVKAGMAAIVCLARRGAGDSMSAGFSERRTRYLHEFPYSARG